MRPLVLAVLLGSASPQEDVTKLVELLRSDNVEVRQEAAQKLAALGEKAEPALRREAGSGDSDIALRAREILATIENKRLENAWDERVRRLPETCADATWKMLDDGKEMGTLKIHTSIEKGKLVFEDQFDVDWRGNRVRMSIKQESSPDHELRLSRIAVTANEPELSYSAEAKEGKLLLKRKAQSAQLDLPRNLLTGGALFRAVPALPKRKGFAFKFFLLDETGRISEESTFSCAGEEEITHDGRKVKAWKWAFVREQVIVGEDANDYYWVSEDRILRILRTHGREFVLSSALK